RALAAWRARGVVAAGLCFIGLFFCYLAVNVPAQENRPTGSNSSPPDPALTPLSEGATEPIGNTAGSWGVTAGGAATYSVPLELPPGRRGMQPGLSLVYNSRDKDGDLGVGWSLAGFSAITHCGSNLSIDGAVG